MWCIEDEGLLGVHEVSASLVKIRTTICSRLHALLSKNKLTVSFTRNSGKKTVDCKCDRGVWAIPRCQTSLFLRAVSSRYLYFGEHLVYRGYHQGPVLVAPVDIFHSLSFEEMAQSEF